MKYLINKIDKEHVVCRDEFCIRSDRWTLVEADSEGWIAHTGTECPLPPTCRVEIKDRDGTIYHERAAKSNVWHATHYYRPIIAEKVQEPEPTKLNSPRRCSRCFTDDMGKHHPHCPDRVGAARSVLPPQYDPADLEYEKQRAEKEAERKHMEIKEAELKRMMLLDRLKAAHKAAQQIPDLEAELREVLGSMGYDLVARSPFVEPEAQGDARFVADVITGTMRFNVRDMGLKTDAAPEPGMLDWRNWRKGDEIARRNKYIAPYWSKDIYTVQCRWETSGEVIGFLGITDDNGVFRRLCDHTNCISKNFRFHSRPAKGE